VIKGKQRSDDLSGDDRTPGGDEKSEGNNVDAWEMKDKP
jgi:hypothetical protein